MPVAEFTKVVTELTDDASRLLEAVRPLLSQADEQDRYRLLSAFLADLADGISERNGRSSGGSELAELQRKCSTLEEERAVQVDDLRLLRKDLADRDLRLGSFEERYKELESIAVQRNSRVVALQKELDEAHVQLTARQADLHHLQSDFDRLQVQAQRASSAAEDRSQLDRAEERNVELIRRNEELVRELGQLRLEKDRQIGVLNEMLTEARSQATKSEAEVLGALWTRLAATQPKALAEANGVPDGHNIERLVEVLRELVNFVDLLEKNMRSVVQKYAKTEQLRPAWRIYTGMDDLHAVVRGILTAKGGRPAAVLRIRLRPIDSWTYSALLAGDSAIEHVESELKNHLRGVRGLERDPNGKIKDYVNDKGPYANNDGPAHFLQQIRQIMAEKLREILGRPQSLQPGDGKSA